MAKKPPVTIIKEAIEKEEKVAYLKNIQQYTWIIILCCVINVLFLIVFLQQKKPVDFQEIGLSSNTRQLLKEIENQIVTLDNTFEKLIQKVATVEMVESTFRKNMKKNTRSLIKELKEIEKKIDAAQNKILDIRKKIVKNKMQK